MMTGLLSRSSRDANGRLHKRAERLIIVGRLPRADFDTRQLLKVHFEDGSTGIVFSEEVERGIVAGHLGRFGGVRCHIKRGVSQMRPKDSPPFTES
jgi:hypothetical protein